MKLTPRVLFVEDARCEEVVLALKARPDVFVIQLTYYAVDKERKTADGVPYITAQTITHTRGSNDGVWWLSTDSNAFLSIPGVKERG